MDVAPLLYPLEQTAPTCDYPDVGDVRLGTVYAGGSLTGTLVVASCDYPNESDVRLGVVYGFSTLTGTLDTGAVNPDAPSPGAYPFAAIAACLRNRLSVSLGVPAAYINLVANDRYKVTETEPVFVYVRVYGPGQPQDPALSFQNAGAGRGARPVARRIRCYIYTRSGEDVYGIDNTALLGADPNLTFASGAGHFIAEEKVFNALDDYTPLASNGSGLTVGPIHTLDSTTGPAERKPEGDEGLVRSHLDFEAVYISAIDPRDPAP